MPVEVVSYMLSNENIQKRLQFQIVLQCAPFLKGIKISSITNVDKKDCKELRAVLKGTGIDYKILTVRKGRCLVFFYRKKEFETYLKDGHIQNFLKEYGYELFRVDDILKRLSARVCKYSVENIEFPHEIGVFLDYPIEDVKGFIQNEGKECLMAGYWKVYHNPGKAQMLFHAYDKAKTSAVNEFLTGMSIRDIAA